MTIDPQSSVPVGAGEVTHSLELHFGRVLTEPEWEEIASRAAKLPFVKSMTAHARPVPLHGSAPSGETETGWQPVSFDRHIVSRIEVIDENGRAYTRHDLFIDVVSLQDDNRTLKLFVRPRKGNYALPPHPGAPPSSPPEPEFAPEELASLRADFEEWLGKRNMPPEVRAMLLPWKSSPEPSSLLSTLEQLEATLLGTNGFAAHDTARLNYAYELVRQALAAMKGT